MTFVFGFAYLRFSVISMHTGICIRLAWSIAYIAFHFYFGSDAEIWILLS